MSLNSQLKYLPRFEESSFLYLFIKTNGKGDRALYRTIVIVFNENNNIFLQVRHRGLFRFHR